jgi:dolichol-phosphate mannosyltransferase
MQAGRWVLAGARRSSRVASGRAWGATRFASGRARGAAGLAFRLAQAGAGAIVVVRLARGRRRIPPLAAADPPAPGVAVSVVVPARDEAARIGRCLAPLRDDPDVAEVLVVDDRSSDGTAAVAREFGARVVAGAELPEGWVGKPWALQQGLEAAAGDVVVTLDADTRPQPRLVRALVASLGDERELVTAGVRFVCDTWLERLLHPSLLATLVYRYGPVGVDEHRPVPARVLANGQAQVFRRAAMVREGGFAHSAAHLTDDVAQARALAARGWRVRMVDCADLVSVRMHASGRELWREWGRSIAMADVTPPGWQALDVAVVWLAMALPLARIAVGRGTRLDRVLAAVRVALVPGLARAYARRDAAFWLSPLADVAAAARLTWSAVRPSRTWRGRTYPAA